MAYIGHWERSLQKSTVWLKELCEELRWDNIDDCYLALRSVLHALRDRLTPDEAADLAAQLPLVIKGVFYDGWKPGATPVKVRRKEDFLRRVEIPLLRGVADADVEHVTRTVFGLLSRHIAPGEIEDVRRMLPGELIELWPEGNGG